MSKIKAVDLIYFHFHFHFHFLFLELRVRVRVTRSGGHIIYGRM